MFQDREVKFNDYIIPDGKPVAYLHGLISAYNQQYGGKVVQHKKTKGYYRITHFGILNANGRSELQVHYLSFYKEKGIDITVVPHSRPCFEFFDGRFDFTVEGLD